MKWLRGTRLYKDRITLNCALGHSLRQTLMWAESGQERDVSRNQFKMGFRMFCRNLCNLYNPASMESRLSKWLPYYHRTHLQASLTTAQLFLTSDPDAVTYNPPCLSRTTSINSFYGRKTPRQHIRDREERLLHWKKTRAARQRAHSHTVNLTVLS